MTYIVEYIGVSIPFSVYVRRGGKFKWSGQPNEKRDVGMTHHATLTKLHSVHSPSFTWSPHEKYTINV